MKKAYVDVREYKKYKEESIEQARLLLLIIKV